MTPSVQTWFVYFFVSVQPFSTNFALDLSFYKVMATVRFMLNGFTEAENGLKSTWIRAPPRLGVSPIRPNGILVAT